MSRYLFIGAHVDDVELSCGGTIVKLLELGHKVTCLSLSYYYGKSLIEEWAASMKTLNVSFCWINDFTVRRFNNERQEILDYLIQQIGYDYVFTHSSNDLHQDHRVVGEESFRAFKKTNLITYTADWNQRDFKKNYFVKLKRGHIETKLKALSCYKSQRHRDYMRPDYVWADALVNGVMCGSELAEAFEVVNHVS